VDNIDTKTLVPLIQEHVALGTRIFADSWPAYLGLNDLGYKHFSVVHKSPFKQKCNNIKTGEEIIYSTTIEWAWKISKDHFRQINGTSSAL